MNIKKFVSKATDGLLDDVFRQSFLVSVLSSLAAVILFVAAVPHFVDDPWPKVMAFVLLTVGILSVAILLLTIFDRKHHYIWRRVFMAVVIFFFGYMCYDGGPGGFLHIWILLLPAFSFITFGIFEGFITAVPVFLIMELFFFGPLNQFIKFPDEGAISYDFKLRMTLVYLVCLLLGFFAELLRRVAAKRLSSYTENFKYASMHDSLTGLANQNLLAKYLDDMYENRTEGSSLGCLFVDVDSFKNVNDKYGHLFGNVVLIRIGEILSQEKEAFVCRWGGDEYVVCFANISEDVLMRIGEKYRAEIAACRFKDYPKFHITVSVGAVVLPVDESFNFDHVLDLADFANRTAKNNGKDNVSLAKKDQIAA